MKEIIEINFSKVFSNAGVYVSIAFGASVATFFSIEKAMEYGYNISIDAKNLKFNFSR